MADHTHFITYIQGQGKPVENTKSFVGGLSFDTDEEKLSQFFVGMGYSVLSVDMKTDEKSRKRGEWGGVRDCRGLLQIIGLEAAWVLHVFSMERYVCRRNIVQFCYYI